MLVGIEASAAIERRRSGVGNYAANIIQELRRLGEGGRDIDLLLFANRRDQLDPLPCSLYDRDRLPLRTLWMQLGLPRSIIRTHPDLCHFPNHLAPVVRQLETPFVVTMHDMSVYRCPEHHPLKTVAVHRAIVPRVARRAKLILTVSESARQDILFYLKIPPERVRVVYEGIDPRFRMRAEANRALPGVLQRYDITFPYLLTVGTVEPRKNHAGLIGAFANLVLQERLPHHLLIVGPHGWKEGGIMERVRTSGVADRIHFLGYVPATDLPALYCGAEAFAFPSWYEGFGLPVLEALASGVPTLISNDPALCEVAGAGATLVVDPSSVEDIAAGLHRLLTDGPLRALLRARGYARSYNFSWEKCAAETYAQYREVLASPVRATRQCLPG